jgi:NADP-dependent 3-hydroxy acid dehydrogenase YdfG
MPKEALYSNATMGKVVAITGASSGIGQAAAEHFGRLGMPVALLARRADRLDAIVHSICAAGGRAVAVAGDVTQEADVDRLISTALREFGRLDVMIANAGVGFHGTLADTSPEVMRRLIDVNFMGTFYAARAAVPVFRQQRGGHLILVSSIAGQRTVGSRTAYAATKAAQARFGESLRVELAGTGVHVSVVFPVSTLTEFHETIRREFGHATPALGPSQSAEEVARAIAWCVEHPRAEVYPYWKSRALVILNAVAPALVDRFMEKYERRR